MNTPGPLFFVSLFFMVVLGMGEFLVSLLWIPAYFRTGIPLLTKEFRPKDHFEFSLDIPALEQTLQGFWRPRVVFKELAPGEYAFRHHFTSRTPLQGHIKFDSLRGVVVIKGYAYWTLLLFPLPIFLLVSSLEGVPLLTLPAFLLVFGLIIGLNFLFQRRIYQQVVEAVQKMVGSSELY